VQLRRDDAAPDGAPEITHDTTALGVVAAGNPATAEAAAGVLRDGGNAFDAALAGLCMACVSEPVLASLGGGGFLMARPAGGEPVLYDFFTQTPKRPRPAGDIDFHATHADFGPATQEFHIGLGSIATPGVVKGLFAIHDDLSSLPFERLIEPAAAAARDGTPMEPLQAFILSVVETIFSATPESLALYRSHLKDGALLQDGEVHRAPELGDSFEALARDGEALFYQGDLARRMVDDGLARGGHLTMDDLAEYRVIKRAPLVRDHGGHRLATNPGPSSGGMLIAFALALLDGADMGPFGGPNHLCLLARAMAATSRARVEARLDDDGAAERLLDHGLLDKYHSEVLGAPPAHRGTTHISVVDGMGNAAALSVSNGEGSAYIPAGTGIMLNNMLGEEDVNPHGFHAWPADRRMASMMAPTLVFSPGGRTMALGSGGSNRIRSAMIQVLVALLDFNLPLHEAVAAPRIHLEGGLLSIEPGLDPTALDALLNNHPNHKLFPTRNMFFGGTHVACVGPDGPIGAGDLRRGGISIIT
jgi:gamma-glutamyltranspeptidase/glutathione hydrolase